MNIPSSWDTTFSVGNDLMDTQHRRLLGICANVAALAGDEGPAVVEGFHEALHDLSEYARTHFAAEEALLQSCGYPHFDSHVAEHSECLMRLNDFLFAATQGIIAKAPLQAFLSEWWVTHVRESDIRYRDFVRSTF